MNVKISVFVIYVELFRYLLLYNLYYCTFNKKLRLKISNLLRNLFYKETLSFFLDRDKSIDNVS